MNEIEIQKLVIKEAFNKTKALPDFGGIGNDNSIKIRNYIWKVCGYLSEEEKATIDNEKQTTKKNALIVLYKLWSALTKNIRYNIDAKGRSVTIPRFGSFMRDPNDPQCVSFIPTLELANVLQTDRPSGEFNMDQNQTGPEWQRIATAAAVPNQEIAQLLTSAVMMMAVQKAKTGETVSINLKFGKLSLSSGQIQFLSDRLQNVNPQSQSAMSVRRSADDYEERSPSPVRMSIPSSTMVSPRNDSASPDRLGQSLQVKSPLRQDNPDLKLQYQTSNQLFANAYARSMVSKVQPKLMKKPTKMQNIFAARRGKSVLEK